MTPQPMTDQEIADRLADCDRFETALREIDAIPYNIYATSPEGRSIADIVSNALRPKNNTTQDRDSS